MKKILCLLLIIMSLSTSMVYAHDISPLRRGEPCPTAGCNGSVIKSTIWINQVEYETGKHGSCNINVAHKYMWDEKFTKWECGSCGFQRINSTNECKNYRCVKY